jgi:hypothetical protein
VALQDGVPIQLHRPELVAIEVTPTVPDAAMNEEDRSGIAHKDHDRQHDQKRENDDEDRQGNDDIEYAPGTDLTPRQGPGHAPVALDTRDSACHVIGHD